MIAMAVPQALGFDVMKKKSVRMVNIDAPQTHKHCASLLLRHATRARSATPKLALSGNSPREPSIQQQNESNPKVSTLPGRSKNANVCKPLYMRPESIMRQSSSSDAAMSDTLSDSLRLSSFS